MALNYALASLGSTITATDGNAAAANLINGNRVYASGGWDGTIGSQIVISFPAPRQISAVSLCCFTDGTASDSASTFSGFGVTAARVEAFVNNAWVVAAEYDYNNFNLKTVRFGVVVATKIRVTPLSSSDGYGRFAEIEVYYNPPTGTNYARASNGSTASGPGAAANLINGSRNYYNGNWNGDYGNEIIIDFASARKISEVHIFGIPGSENVDASETAGGYHVTAARVDALVSGNWITVGQYAGSDFNWKIVRFAAVTATQIRVIPLASVTDTTCRLAEIEAYYNVPFSIATSSPLPSGLSGLAYSAVIETETTKSAVVVESAGGLPSGTSVAASGTSVVLSGTPASSGNYNVVIRLSDGESSLTKAFAVTIKVPPVSLWAKRQSVPLADLEAWHALDTAASGAEVEDFARKNRPLTAASSPPTLVPNVINGQPGIYFDGTRSPLKFSGNTLFRHAFIVASFEAATFAGYEGLLSGVTTNPILVGNQGTDKFINLTLSQYGEYKYLKNYISSPESAQNAPVAGKTAIIEIAFPPSLFLDGIQIGQDRNLTNRKWKGYFIESLVYSEIKNDCERRKIYEYFAQKFHLWRQTSFGLNIFPFPNNHKTPGSSFVNELSSVSISGAQKTRSKSGLIRSFDASFTSRYQSEFEAAEAFWFQNRRRCVFEDCAVYPPVAYTGRITTPLDRDPQSINNVGYKFGFETSGGTLPGGDGFNAASGLDFIYEG